MVLIEEFNGYENLKKERDNAVNGGCRQEVVSAFDSVLLDYRRAHNIYEVGDLVLRNDGFSNVLGITKIDGDYADLIRRVDGEPRWSRFKLIEIRHATDAEIEAGRRL